jgi:ABC-2 type transport system ATP-binding protein
MTEEVSDIAGPSDRTIPTIEAKGVVVRYGDIVALDNLSLKISKGAVGLIGPNGAGKSTFIKSVLGLITPQAGSIKVCGLDSVTDHMLIRDMVGYMPEHDCLIETMTAVELVSYMGGLAGMSKDDAMPRSHEVLDFVGLGEERYRPISTYSTGMKQRAKLAQAIVHDPAILVLDEPTNGMDPIGREEMLDLISRIASTDKSVLVSSHILQDVEKICHDVIIVNGGNAIVQGDINTLLSQAKGRYQLKVRGPSDSIKAFLQQLKGQYQIIAESENYDQATVVLFNEKGSSGIFEQASRSGVQIRSYVPDRITLEDVFITSVREGKK